MQEQLKLGSTFAILTIFSICTCIKYFVMVVPMEWISVIYFNLFQILFNMIYFSLLG